MKVNWLVFPHGIMAGRRHSWVFWFQLLDSSQQHTCLKSQETHSKFRAAIRVKELGTLDMEVTFSSSRELPRLSLGQESIPGSLPGPAKSSRWALISGLICPEREVQILTVPWNGGGGSELPCIGTDPRACMGLEGMLCPLTWKNFSQAK